jgi:hypothetical protein
LPGTDPILQVRLDETVQVVPVMVLVFVSADTGANARRIKLKKARAVFDSRLTDEDRAWVEQRDPVCHTSGGVTTCGQPVQAPKLEEHHRPYNTGALPDDAWEPCGIQFQVVGEIAISLPESVGQALVDLYPMWAAFGPLADCSGFGYGWLGRQASFAEGDHAVVYLPDPEEMQGNEKFCVAAHELGHAFGFEDVFGGEPEYIMGSGCKPLDHCPREQARRWALRYQKFLFDRGLHALPPEEGPAPVVVSWDVGHPTSLEPPLIMEIPTTCCTVDDLELSLATLDECALAGGSAQDAVGCTETPAFCCIEDGGAEIRAECSSQTRESPVGAVTNPTNPDRCWTQCCANDTMAIVSTGWDCELRVQAQPDEGWRLAPDACSEIY